MNEVDFYDKDQTDALLAGKVSGSGDIGTDLKPIKIVDGVAVAVANQLVDTASNQDNISGRKTFTPDNGAVTLVGTGSGNTHPVFAVRMTSLPDGADPSGGIWGGLQYLNSASKEVGSVTFNRSTNGDSYVHIFVKNSNNLNTGFKVYKTLAGDNYATSPSRTYNSANTADVVTQGSLASNPEVVHTTGNETIDGTKKFEKQSWIPTIGGELTRPRDASAVGKWIRWCAFANEYSANNIVEMIGTNANNGVFYIMFSVAGGGGFERYSSLVQGGPNNAGYKVVVILNQSTNTHEVWIYAAQTTTSYIAAGLKWGRKPTIINEEYDTLPASGYGNPYYVLGSA